MMDVHLALDALLAFIVVLFVPLGLWRGAAREAMVSAAILLGAALAGAWARPWGDDLAARTAFEPPTARFAVAVASLVLCALCLGYGGGAAWRGAQPGTFGRLVGGLLAAFNGVLLLGFALNFLDRYLLEGDSRDIIRDGNVARVLMTEFGWLLLGGAVVLFGIVAVGLLLNTLRGNPRPTPPFPAVAPPAPIASSSRRRPPRVPAGTDAGKSEPVWHALDDEADRLSADAFQRPASDRRSADESRLERPVAVADEAPERRYGGMRQQRDSETLGGRHAPTSSAPANEWLRRTAAMSRPSESGTDASVRSGAADRAAPSDRRQRTEPPAADPPPNFSIVDLGEVRRSQRGQWRPEETFGAGSPESSEVDGDRRRFGSSASSGAESSRRCATCSAPLSSRDTFCTACGAEV